VESLGIWECDDGAGVDYDGDFRIERKIEVWRKGAIGFSVSHCVNNRHATERSSSFIIQLDQ
jgi:hypothetical protein